MGFACIRVDPVRLDVPLAPNSVRPRAPPLTGRISIRHPKSAIRNRTFRLMKIVALAGGVGAAKFLSGLVEVVSPSDVTIVVNTGDDFQWMGLYICPDLDTVTYTLAGRANPETGWGIRDDTIHTLSRLRELGVDAWFQLGDRDLATHVFRTNELRTGVSLTDVTKTICKMNRIDPILLPMTDSYVPTLVHTTEGRMHLQEYFVRRKCEPVVRGFTYLDIEESRPAPGVLEALREADAILVCPSNPLISIAPILAVPGIRPALRESAAKRIAITPIIGGKAMKGPAATMLQQLGQEASAVSVARLYRDFIDIFVLDQEDACLEPQISSLSLNVNIASTRMNSQQTKVELARRVLGMVA